MSSESIVLYLRWDDISLEGTTQLRLHCSLMAPHLSWADTSLGLTHTDSYWLTSTHTLLFSLHESELPESSWFTPLFSNSNPSFSFVLISNYSHSIVLFFKYPESYWLNPLSSWQIISSLLFSLNHMDSLPFLTILIVLSAIVLSCNLKLPKTYINPSIFLPLQADISLHNHHHPLIFCTIGTTQCSRYYSEL